MKILYQEGNRQETEKGRPWVQLARHGSDFNVTGELYPVYILRWEISGEPIEDWGEYGREYRPSVSERGRELLDRVVESDAMAIRIAIAKFDKLAR